MKRLRFYMSNTDTIHHESLYMVIAKWAQDAGMKGCTILSGVTGFGSSSQLHNNKFWELNIKHPMVVEIIDEESKLKAFVHEIKADLNSMGKGFLITLEPVEILMDIQGAP
ncbi:DUF190 domain-containing protein [Segatella bryantii]|uniref:DUF190 domain-containing protein n=1 Tax=Segatella bryantii TaxID=77095 RepID=UPI0024311D4C|nr:DUF190 domain-containing protein [Segatella bryantii]